VIGSGEIPLAELLRAFYDAGYRGTYTLELFSRLELPDSLWAGDLAGLILDNRAGLEDAWRRAMAA
jgi:sugar phosphate isomerase/epimerase